VGQSYKRVRVALILFLFWCERIGTEKELRKALTFFFFFLTGICMKLDMFSWTKKEKKNTRWDAVETLCIWGFFSTPSLFWVGTEILS